VSVAKMDDLLGQALRGSYAIGYFEMWDQYSLAAAMQAAEELHSPAILGFGGAVTNQAWLDEGGVEELACLARHLAERSRVPTAVLFNEARTYSQIVRALRAGCNAVMLETSHLPYEENIALTRQVVEAAHAVGASVEAELGHLADATDPYGPAALTDPVQAAHFVERTGVDVLAVSIGNVHVLADGEAGVDLGLLARIHQAVPVPLSLHGGSGFPASAVRAAIGCGVAKFNVGTRLKQAFLAGVRAALPPERDITNIHPFVGSREESDILLQGAARVKAEIKKLTVLYGSAGQATGERRSIHVDEGAVAPGA